MKKILFLILLIFSLSACSLNNQETDKEVNMTGYIYKYSWEKSYDSYNHELCQNGDFVFIEKDNNNISYGLEFSQDFNFNDFDINYFDPFKLDEDKLFIIEGEKIVENKSLEIDCDIPAQRPFDICKKPGINEIKIKCRKIINVKIIETID
jgi:hypothetical protein